MDQFSRQRRSIRTNFENYQYHGNLHWRVYENLFNDCTKQIERRINMKLDIKLNAWSQFLSDNIEGEFTSQDFQTYFSKNFQQYTDSGFFELINDSVLVLGKIESITYSIGDKQFKHEFEKSTPLISIGDLPLVSFPVFLTTRGLMDIDLQDPKHIAVLSGTIEAEEEILDNIENNLIRGNHSLQSHENGIDDMELEEEKEIVTFTPDPELQNQIVGNYPQSNYVLFQGKNKDPVSKHHKREIVIKKVKTLKNQTGFQAASTEERA